MVLQVYCFHGLATIRKSAVSRLKANFEPLSGLLLTGFRFLRDLLPSNI